MKDAIEKRIRDLTESITKEQKPCDAMHAAQAILSLTQALATLDNMKK